MYPCLHTFKCIRISNEFYVNFLLAIYSQVDCIQNYLGLIYAQKVTQSIHINEFLCSECWLFYANSSLLGDFPNSILYIFSELTQWQINGGITKNIRFPRWSKNWPWIWFGGYAALTFSSVDSWKVCAFCSYYSRPKFWRSFWVFCKMSPSPNGTV